MPKVSLERRHDGKVSLTLATNGHDVIRIPNPDATPHRPGSQRARAWQIVSLMDGLTVQEGNDILRKLEYNIQGANGRPLGWIVDAVSDGYAEIHAGQRPSTTKSKVCPAPGCNAKFEGPGWDGIDSHWQSAHHDICAFADLWTILKNVEATSQPARQRAIVVHQCDNCGETFSGVRQARYCSDRCRYDAANKRRRSD